MLKALLRKMLQGAMMILITSSVTFFLLSSTGGDAFSSLQENPQVSPETIENLRSTYGLDQPVVVRYAEWMKKAFRGDLGESFYFRTPVLGLVFSRLISTLSISSVAILMAVLITGLLCITSVRYNWRLMSVFIEILILSSSSVPRILLALLALALVGITESFLSFFAAACVLAIPLIGLFLAQFHDELRNAMNEDFVKLARAKGLRERVVIARHAVRAALNPVLTIFGLSIGGLLAGSVILESVLARPGLGSLMVIAVRSRDIPLIMGVVLIASVTVWLGNALAELLQMLNDKRLA